ncbi:hypothetical protein QR680_002369 [Steinernema hermaphroditum]|uniref:J domain-containing protein n=1 Tax=Steinernema hermaphroditum TaxID=289476 RepID=A0AA39H2F0_9BILA|nr:hypothetical protein QR680_002369 [Steinernema hermaphroditum]
MDGASMQNLGDDNLYGLLGCSKSSTPEQIMAEYRARVRDYHPDKVSPQELEATKKFQKLLYAKEILTNPSKRYLYDMWLSMGEGTSLEQWMANKERVAQVVFEKFSKYYNYLLRSDNALGKHVPYTHVETFRISKHHRSSWSSMVTC